MATETVRMKFVMNIIDPNPGAVIVKGNLKFDRILSGKFPDNFKVIGCYYTLYHIRGHGSTYGVYDQNDVSLNINLYHAKIPSGDYSDTNNLRLDLSNNIYMNLEYLNFKNTGLYPHFDFTRSSYLELTILCEILTQKLSTPTNLRLASNVAVVSTPVTLSWGAVANATGNNVTGYDIYRDGSFYKSVGVVTSTPVYCDKLGGSSYFQVLAKGSAGSGYYSSLSSSITLKAYGKPKAPNLKTINGHTAQYINIGDSITSLPLVWDAVDAPANGVITGYRVYRSYDNWATRVTLATVNTTSYNASIEGGQNASFAVGAVGSGNVVSDDSRRVYANRISKPTEPIFTEPAAGGYEETLSVKWNETSVANATITYKIQYCIGNEPDINENWKDLTTWISTLSALFYMANAEKGKYIRFRVQARATATHGGYVDSDWGLTTNAIYRYANPAKPSNLVLKDTATNKLDFSEDELTVMWDYTHPVLAAAFNSYEVHVSIGGNSNWEIIQHISDINTKSYKYNIKEFVSRGQTVYFRIAIKDELGAYTLGDQKSIIRNSLLKISTVSSTVSGDQGLPYLNLSFLPAIGRYGQKGTYTIGIYKSSNFKKTLINRKTIVFSGATVESGLNVTIQNLKDVCTDLYNDVIINKKIKQEMIVEIILEDLDFPSAKTYFSHKVDLNYGTVPSAVTGLEIKLETSHTDGSANYGNFKDEVSILYNPADWLNADETEEGREIKYELLIEDNLEILTDLTEITNILKNYNDKKEIIFSIVPIQYYSDGVARGIPTRKAFGYGRSLNAKEIVTKTIKKSSSKVEGTLNIRDLGMSENYANFDRIEVEISTSPISRIEVSPIVLFENKNSGIINFILEGVGEGKQDLNISLKVYNTSDYMIETILPTIEIKELLISLMVREKFLGVNVPSEYDYNGDKESFRVEGKEDNIEAALAVFQSGPNNNRGPYLRFLIPTVNQNSAEIGFDGQDFNFIFNKNKYKFYTTRDKIPWSEISNVPETFPPSAHGHLWTEIEGQIPIEQIDGNIPAERIEGQIPIEQIDGIDISHLVTTENYNDISFWMAQGPYVTSHNGDAVEGKPSEWGTTFSTVAGGADAACVQIFRDSSNNEWIRRGNASGWSGGNGTLDGKDVWKPLVAYVDQDRTMLPHLYRLNMTVDSLDEKNWWNWLRLFRLNKEKMYSVLDMNDNQTVFSLRFPYYENGEQIGVNAYRLNVYNQKSVGTSWYQFLTTKQAQAGWAARQTVAANEIKKITIKFPNAFTSNPVVQVMCIDTGSPKFRWHVNRVTTTEFDLTIIAEHPSGSLGILPMWLAINLAE